METIRSNQIRQEINDLKSQEIWIHSLISRLMIEANQLDLQCEELTRSGLELRGKIRDLEAELKDTI